MSVTDGCHWCDGGRSEFFLEVQISQLSDWESSRSLVISLPFTHRLNSGGGNSLSVHLTGACAAGVGLFAVSLGI